MLAAGEDAVFI